MNDTTLVAIDQSHIHRRAIYEAEDYAPVSGNPYAPLSPTVTLQRMQVVAGQVHVCRLHRGVQVRQDAPNPRSKGCGNAAGVSPREERQQPLVCDVDMETVT